jgi:hypothetical protein
MKTYNLNGYIVESEQGVRVEVRPDTNGPKVQTLRVAISREVVQRDGDGKVILPERAAVSRLKPKSGNGQGILMLFPEKNGGDDRAFIIAGFDHWRHRSSVGIGQLTTAEILEQSSGYGAWGSGVAFLAILKPGQRIASTCHGNVTEVISWDGKSISRSRMTDEELTQAGILEVGEVEEL